MSVLGVKVDENPFYCSYDDDCWVVLAQEIMASYAQSYACLIPTTAMSQEEYNRLDAKSYAPIRRGILNKVQNGPLGNVVSMPAIYDAFEQKRRAYKKSMGVIWKDDNLK